MASERLLTYDEIADRLGVSSEWLRRRVHLRTIPHIKLGKHVRFTEAQYQQIVASGNRPATGDPGATPLATRRRRVPREPDF